MRKLDFDPSKPTSAQTYQRMLGYLKPVLVFFLLSIIGFAIYGYTQAKLAAMIEDMLKAVEGASSGDPGNMRLMLPLMILGIFAARGLGSFMGSYFLALVSNSVSHNMRTELFDAILGLPRSYYDAQSPGRILSIISYNVSQILAAITSAIKVLIREGMTVVAILGYMLYLNWKLTLTFFVFGAIIGPVVSIVGKKFRKQAKKVQASAAEVSHVANETIRGYTQMKLFGATQIERERFRYASKKNIRNSMKIVVTKEISSPVVQFLSAGAMCVIVYIALDPMLMEGTDPKQFVAFLSLAALLPKPIRQLTEVQDVIYRGLAGADSVFEILDETPETDKGIQPAEGVKGDLEFRDVFFSYPGAAEPALKGISLHIPKGTSLALVGKSGSGKSTIANLLPRFYQDYEGEILADGVEIRDYGLESWREKVAMVSQDVRIFNDTLRNNIAYGSLHDKSDEEIMAAAKAAHVWEFAKDLPGGMNADLGQDGSLLSGGQKQRVAIARAILKDATILILDEATSALDNESEVLIQRALESVMENRTTIVIAHRLSTIENSDNIAVLENGQIIEQGNHQSLIEQGGIYAHLHSRDFEAEEDTDTY